MLPVCRYVSVLGACFTVLGSMAPAQAQVDMYEEGTSILQQLMHREMKPEGEAVPLGAYPRIDIAMAGLEKVIALFQEDPEGISLGWLLTEQAPPSVRPANWFTLMTKSRWASDQSYEERLYNAIMSSPADLRPSDVFGLALDSCGNDYLLAMLTAHNLLKEVTYCGREGQPAVIAYAAGEPENPDRWQRASANDLSARLAQLRPAGDPHSGDKMGPWYHMFGLFFIGGSVSGEEVQLAAWIENGSRLLGLGSGRDPFKEAVNNWAVGVNFGVNLLIPKGFYTPDDLTAYTADQLQWVLDDLAAMQVEARNDSAYYQLGSDLSFGVVDGGRAGAAALVELALLAEQKRIEDEINRRVMVGQTEMRTN